jgi:hypothetical protein
VLAEELRGIDDGDLNIRLSGSPAPIIDRLLIRVVLPLENKTTNLIAINGTHARMKDCTIVLPFDVTLPQQLDRGMETADAFLRRILHLPVFASSPFYTSDTHPHLLLRVKGRIEHVVGKYPLLDFGTDSFV